MGTPCKVFNGPAVILEAPCQAGMRVNVGVVQPLLFHFNEHTKFICDKPDAFLPGLPDGECFDPGNYSISLFANKDYWGKDVRWDTEDCDGVSADSARATDAGAVTTTAGLANVIHIGSGGTLPFFKAFTANDAVSDVFAKTWKPTERLLKALLKHSHDLSLTERHFVELFVESGIKAYKKVRKEDER